MNPGGGGSGEAAGAQNQADALRAGNGGVWRLERGDWLRLALAAIPIVALVVLGIVVL